MILYPTTKVYTWSYLLKPVKLLCNVVQPSGAITGRWPVSMGRGGMHIVTASSYLCTHRGAVLVEEIDYKAIWSVSVFWNVSGCYGSDSHQELVSSAKVKTSSGPSSDAKFLAVTVSCIPKQEKAAAMVTKWTHKENNNVVIATFITILLWESRPQANVSSHRHDDVEYFNPTFNGDLFYHCCRDMNYGMVVCMYDRNVYSEKTFWHQMLTFLNQISIRHSAKIC